MSRVLILDFGSQTTQLIARRVREMSVYCEIIPCTSRMDEIERFAPDALILSGGPSSTTEEFSPEAPEGIWGLGIPILGICYGMQHMIGTLGGRVSRALHAEFGRRELRLDKKHPLFHGLGRSDIVWMSHGDQVDDLPPGAVGIASSETCPVAAVAFEGVPFFGVQFHPEVHHTPCGKQLLGNFLFRIADLDADWATGKFIEESVAKISHLVGERDQVVMGLSGGVDSTVAAALIAKAIGDRLHCIYVNHGLHREGEIQDVRKVFADSFAGGNLTVVDAEQRFMDVLDGIADPELKRKKIGYTFIEVFDEAAKKLPNANFLGQGTLYPDVIESVSFQGGPSAVIKSHHNVGGLPERMNLKLVEPLRELFKDEVREVGRKLGLPHHVVERQPFPGPGLAIRVLGPLSKDRLRTARSADEIVRQEVARGFESGAMEEGCIWQWFAVLLPVKSVGVMGDARTYEETVCVRTVQSTDGMTADFGRIPFPILQRMSTRIINEVAGVNRVVYDISSKPPSTIEWE